MSATKESGDYIVSLEIDYPETLGSVTTIVHQWFFAGNSGKPRDCHLVVMEGLGCVW